MTIERLSATLDNVRAVLDTLDAIGKTVSTVTFEQADGALSYCAGFWYSLSIRQPSGNEYKRDFYDVEKLESFVDALRVGAILGAGIEYDF